jgi:hypothetical protein
MKKLLLTFIPCLLAWTAVFFTVNHAAPAGELPDIPDCPLHEACVKALQEEQAVLLPRFPADIAGGFAGTGAAFLLFRGKHRFKFLLQKT